MKTVSFRFKNTLMKHPFKTIALIILAACVVYIAWPKDTVRNHDPATGEGLPGGHDEHDGHGHLKPTPLITPVEEAAITPEEAEEISEED